MFETTSHAIVRFEHSNFLEFEIVSDFELRVSDFLLPGGKICDDLKARERYRGPADDLSRLQCHHAAGAGSVRRDASVSGAALWQSFEYSCSGTRSARGD